MAEQQRWSGESGLWSQDLRDRYRGVRNRPLSEDPRPATVDCPFPNQKQP